MHVRDIIDAIARKDLRETEAGFRALAGFPGEEATDGATPETLMAAQDATCDALIADTNIMPGEIRDILDGSDDEPAGNIYADGTAAVQVNRAWWERHFTALCRRGA